MIVNCIFSGNVDDLTTTDQNKVRLKDKHEEAQKNHYSASIKEKPDIYHKEIHPALQELAIFDKELVIKQYEHFIAQQIQPLLPPVVSDPPSVENNNPSAPQLLTTLQEDFGKLDFEDKSGNRFIELHSQLLAAEKICHGLTPIIPYQTIVDRLRGEPEVNYKQQLTDLSSQITERKEQIENSDQYKAMLFLRKTYKA